MATTPISSGFIARFLTRVSTHKLTILVGSLFLLDLIIPDLVPFVDEIVLGILTLLIARWQSRGSQAEPTPASKPPMKDVTPR